MKAGTKVALCLGDEVLAIIDSYEITQEKLDSLPTSSVSGIIDIDWDETWLLSYMGRMYANEFKS